MNSPSIKNSPKPDPIKKVPIPFPIVNLHNHLNNTFSSWLKKNPSIKFQLYRSGIFVLALLITLLWPPEYLLPTIIITTLSWITLAFTKNTIPRFFTLLLTMLSINCFYFITQIFIKLLDR